MTVITGLNEAGKTTLQSALVAGLFGFFNSTDLRRERVATDLRERFEPWNGASYGLRANLMRSDGHEIFVEWDFDDRTRFQVLDAITGEDLTAEHRGGGENVLDHRQMCAVSRELFEQLCLIRQGEIQAISDEAAVSRALESLASSTGREASAQRALDRLDEAIRTEIGTDRATARPLPQARSRAQGIRQKLEEVERQRGALESLAERVREAEDKRREARQRTERARRAFEARKLLEMRRRLDDIVSAREELEEAETRLSKLGDVADLDPGTAEQIVAADSRRNDLLRGLREAEGAAAEAEERIPKLVRDLAEAERVLGELDAFVDGPDGGQLAEVEEIVGRIDAADPGEISEDDEPAEPPSDLLELERRVADESTELERLRAGRLARRRGAWLAGAASTLLAAAAAAGAGAVPAAVALAVVAAVLAGVWLRSAGPVDSEAESRIEELEARRETAAEMREAYERHAAEARGRNEERRSAFEQAQHERERAEAELARLLAPHGLAELTREVALERFRQAVRNRISHSEQRAAVERLQRELGEARKPVENRDEARAELRDVEKRLARLYEACGIDDADLGEARQRYDERVQLNERHEAAIGRREQARARLSGLLTGVTEEEIRREVTTLQAKDVRIEGAGEGSPEALEKAWRESEDERREADGTYRELHGELRGAVRELGEPAQLEEELVHAEEEAARLEEARATLELAKDVLEEAASDTYRDIAPKLNDALSRGLSRVTGGRYDEVLVDDAFRVKVRSPAAGRIVEVDLLSGGTQDQIHLLQRVELVRILQGAEPLPILLDDPLLASDPKRRQSLCQYFAEVSDDHQLIIFASDPATAELVSETCESCSIVDLGDPK